MARCPRCGAAADFLGRTSSGRYAFGPSGPGVLLHLLFFMVVAAGVAPFCYLAGYTALAAAAGVVAVVLALVSVALARRAYRREARSWYRCGACGHEWSPPDPR